MLYLSRITDATVDAFATCVFNVRMRKYASCGPRHTLMLFFTFEINLLLLLLQMTQLVLRYFK